MIEIGKIFDKEGAVSWHLGKAGMIFLGVLVSCCCCKNYHELNSFREHTFIILSFWESEVCSELHWAKINVSAGLPYFLAVPRENSLP